MKRMKMIVIMLVGVGLLLDSLTVNQDCLAGKRYKRHNYSYGHRGWEYHAHYPGCGHYGWEAHTHYPGCGHYGWEAHTHYPGCGHNSWSFFFFGF